MGAGYSKNKKLEEIKRKILTSEDPVIEIVKAVRLGTTDYDFKTLKKIG
jgi:hypothetical protein